MIHHPVLSTCHVQSCSCNVVDDVDVDVDVMFNREISLRLKEAELKELRTTADKADKVHTVP